jgi:predicted HD phosphohydrolase
MTFTRMDRGTAEDWAVIRRATEEWQAAMPARITALLRQLDAQREGFAVTQLAHALQTATRALRAGASEEMIVAALCHDIGTAISLYNHPAIAAEILQPYVSPDVYQIIRTHQDFQGRHYYALLGEDPDARRRYAGERWYATACRFSDEWDQTSFDPAYDALPLETFEPMIARVFGAPRADDATGLVGLVKRPWRSIKRLVRRVSHAVPRAHAE